MKEFGITQDRSFLSNFLDSREIFRLSPRMVEKLRNSEDPYGRYGYGQWLYRIRPDGDESVKEAQKCFEHASENGVADAKQMLSLMAYYGDYFNESKGGIWEKDNVMALILNAQAQEEGSELAAIRHNIDLYVGNLVPADRTKAFEEARKRAEDPDASLLWTEQLGWYYDAEGDKEEAIKAYEKCIEKTAKLSFPYINKLLISWHRKGIKTPAEAAAENGVIVLKKVRSTPPKYPRRYAKIKQTPL